LFVLYFLKKHIFSVRFVNNSGGLLPGGYSLSRDLADGMVYFNSAPALDLRRDKGADAAPC
jgi:hypothetical protein